MACRKNLCTRKIKKENICELCMNDIDCTEHHLIACLKILPFWNVFFSWWKGTMSMSFPVDTYDILFGINNPNKDPMIKQLNFMLLHGLLFNYQCRKKSKYPEFWNT